MKALLALVTVTVVSALVLVVVQATTPVPDYGATAPAVYHVGAVCE